MHEFEAVIEELSTTPLQETAKTLKPPPRYHVLLINDDFTPMDFVVEVLIAFFAMDEIRATKVMLQIHKEGKAVCGTYSRDVAETKVLQINSYSRNQHYPLLCIMKPV